MVKWVWMLAPVMAAQIAIPRLPRPAVIDGDLREWREHAHTDGLWDLARMRRAPWFDPAINRLTVHAGERGDESADLSARYYIAWDARSVYLGAEVTDNVNDVADPAHTPKRWYYKDAICWFLEAPRKAAGQKFGERDNAFCFVIDERRPDYGAWWRHGAPGKSYVEEPLPAGKFEYAIRRGAMGNFVLEARVDMAATFGVSSPEWAGAREGQEWGIEIVHTDPDGGDYGGHLLLYGRGDDDATWGRAVLTAPWRPERRRPE